MILHVVWTKGKGRPIDKFYTSRIKGKVQVDNSGEGNNIGIAKVGAKLTFGNLPSCLRPMEYVACVALYTLLPNLHGISIHTHNHKMQSKHKQNTQCFTIL